MTHEHPTASDRAPWWRPTRRRALVALLLALPIGAGAWWFGGGKWMFQPKRWGEIEAGLIYRSGQLHPFLVEDTLRDEGIQVVLDLAVDEPGRDDHDTENEVTKRLGIRKIDLFGLDGSGLGDPEIYVRAVQEMHKAKQSGTRMLVHCAAGTQRTGGAAALYRMFLQGWGGEEAYAEYLAYRGRPDSFKLMKFLNEHMGAIANRLVAVGVLDEVPSPLPHFGPRGSATSAGP
jgi:hypothetical protein